MTSVGELRTEANDPVLKGSSQLRRITISFPNAMRLRMTER